ncbi:uncharacterized protein BDR25DRAFT_363799 [Lindgomyces ingoldianus]|uniref:Uncharacterized protein n=1 Tax=Lindgomyces ingoldianus TaxID=673940 RepID=A0ACB6Q6W2_9PLEO|nr:uncharacterized protein BDR25DRAFT_363799 [Lindgomyces ingoldianus]KAF2462628.1 hypothetical protein BDR25DRAFT_363799 [Lindgomyces ingoldianus]
MHPYSFRIWVFGGIKRHPPLASGIALWMVLGWHWVLAAFRFLVESNITHLQQLYKPDSALAAFGFLVESNTIHLQQLYKPDSVILYASIWFVGSFWWN